MTGLQVLIVTAEPQGHGFRAIAVGRGRSGRCLLLKICHSGPPMFVQHSDPIKREQAGPTKLPSCGHLAKWCIAAGIEYEPSILVVSLL